MKNILQILLITFLGSSGFSQCESFYLELVSTHPTCNGYWDGSITVNLFEGTAPYDFEITDISGTIFNPDGGNETGFLLEEKWYYINVIDGLGCELIDSVLIVAPAPLLISSSTLVDPSDFDECDGSITIDEITGDFVTLNYIWSPDPESISGAFANVFTDACVGTYNLTIGNENGCTIVGEYTIGYGLSIENHGKAIDIKVKVIDKKIVINLSEKYKQIEISIFDMKGQIVYNAILLDEQNEITPNIDMGVYIYQIKNSNEILQKGQFFLKE